jgi:hypothetical protein
MTRRTFRGFSLQPRLPPRPVINHLMATVVGHLLPPSNFIEGAKTSNAKFGLSIERAHVDARRLDCHGSRHPVDRPHLDRDVRESLETLQHGMIEA